MQDTGPVELLFMYYELMDPCVHDMVKWQHRCVRDPEIEHAEPLDSLGLNGASDDSADEYIPTGAATLLTLKPPPPPPPRAAAVFAGKIVSGQFDEENPFVLISSALLVQPDVGVSDLVVDRIGDNLPQSTEKSRILVIPVGARHKCQQGNPLKHPMYDNYYDE
ncbi:hypothetical protein F511_33993 [Dorcoceras hygrometricum]|uniref:Uncharacterized protein n=1 Tax=Dorcoceras hygrometricum TaxID=472368 RepID=A0A2Z7AP94_9LAMI|nr:hypothetical protein F511_33993 [Dorcoceras hygrometricum]